MPDWDEPSPQLAQNLHQVLRAAAVHAAKREPVSLELMREWHGAIMAGLSMKAAGWAGCYRGGGAAKGIGVEIGNRRGVAASKVAAALKGFEHRLVRSIALLDAVVDKEGANSDDQIAAVIDLCAWVHGEWVRIHPFVNGSGRTARLWVNYLAMRYGLPPFARLRPRPDGGYGTAAGASMRGDWKAMIPVFHAMLSDVLAT